MFAILISAFNVVLGFVLRSVVVKFVVFFALFFVTSEFVPVIVGMLPGTDSLAAAFSNIPSGVAWFANMLKLQVGLSMFFSAAVTSFIIRRIPLIG